MSQDPAIEVVTKLVESAGSRIKFAPGVIGKSTFMYVGLAAVWCIALWKCTPEHPLFDAVLFGAAALATWVVVRETGKMRDFAKENPALALMEGADITEYKRFESQAKGSLIVDKSPLISDPTQPPAEPLISPPPKALEG